MDDLIQPIHAAARIVFLLGSFPGSKTALADPCSANLLCVGQLRPHEIIASHQRL